MVVYMALSQPTHDSKAKFLDAALHVIRTKGYAATTIDDICESAGLTKGSFFHHFKGKQDLALAAAAHFSAKTDGAFANAAYRDLPNPINRLLGYVDLRQQLLRREIPEFTCLLGTMVQETYDSNPSIRKACDKGLSGHAALLEQDIADAMRRRKIDADWDAKSLALHIQAVIQGAFILAKSKNGSDVAFECLEHLKRYLKLLFNHAK